MWGTLSGWLSPPEAPSIWSVSSNTSLDTESEIHEEMKWNEDSCSELDSSKVLDMTSLNYLKSQSINLSLSDPADTHC